MIALTEGQIRIILKTMSDETILSSFHLMKSLLLQATSGNVLSKERCRHMGSFTASGRQDPSSSEYETSDIDSPNEGFTREITGVETHQVRGRNGLLLTPLELEKEKPFFENALFCLKLITTLYTLGFEIGIILFGLKLYKS